MTAADRTALRSLAARTMVDVDGYDLDEARGTLKALARGVLALSCEWDALVAHIEPPAFFQVTDEDVWPGMPRWIRPPPKERKKYTRNPRGTYDRNLPVKRIKK